MNRPVVINLDALYRLNDDEKIFKLVSEQGFQYYDYPLYWKGVTDHIGIGIDARENARKVKELGFKYGLTCRQTHATMMSTTDKDGLKKQIDMICLEIELSSILGAKGTVIHANPQLGKEENIEIFKTYFLPIAKKFNINILVENTFNWTEEKGVFGICTSTAEGLLDFIETLNDPVVGACVDIGHASMRDLHSSPEDMLKVLNKHVYALHLHDNDLKGDNHQMLYTGYININKVIDTLKEISYKGDVTFEILTCYNRGYDSSMELPEELFPSFIKLEYDIGKYIAEKLDS